MPFQRSNVKRSARARRGRSRGAGRACRPPRTPRRSCGPPTRGPSPGSCGRSRRAPPRAPGGRERASRRRMTSAGLAASWTSVWARIAISSPNTRRDLVRVAGAADVAQQRHPVGGLAHSSSNPAASQIHDASRHERSCDSSGWPNALSCASASVATNSPRRSGGVEDGEFSRCIGTPSRSSDPRTRRVAGQSVAGSAHAKGGHHGGHRTPGDEPDQGGSHRRPDRPALVRGPRQRQRGPDGHRRHQRQGRPARTAARAAPRGRRDRRRRRGRRGRRSSSSRTRSTSSSAASTARRGRPSRARPSSRAGRSTSTPSSTRGRSPTRSSSAPARCPRSRSTRSSRG